MTALPSNPDGPFRGDFTAPPIGGDGDGFRPAPDEAFAKLPPHSLEAEMSLLASLMLDKEAVGEVATAIDAKAFYLPEHALVFEIVLELYNAGRAVDSVIVRDELIKRDKLEEVGGARFLADLLGSVPSAAHAKHYAEIVRDKAILRQLINASNRVLQDAYGSHESAHVVLEGAEKRFFEIAEQKVSGDMTKLGSVAMDVYDMIYERGHHGLDTDFTDLDEMLNGLQKGEMIIVAARPSMGKTALAMNMVQNIAGKHVPCAVFSLEMSKQQLAQRMLCSRAGIDGHKVRKGTLTTDEYHRLAQVVNEIDKYPIWVDDSAGLTLLELRAKSRRLARQHGVQLIMIDYMQLMDNPGVESRQQQISEISRGIKGIARELNIPVVCLSQLNRSAESRDGHKPRMSDLRESGSIEQDADVVMLLHREDYYHQQDEDHMPNNTAEIIVAKQRNGPTGVVKLFFDNDTTTFKNLATGVDAF